MNFPFSSVRERTVHFNSGWIQQKTEGGPICESSNTGGKLCLHRGCEEVDKLCKVLKNQLTGKALVATLHSPLPATALCFHAISVSCTVWWLRDDHAC